MARIRTFVAVDLGKAIRARTVALQETLARTGTEVKWVEPENLHVTLLFLGEVDDREVPRVCQIVAAETQKHVAFAMSVEAAGCFPNPRRPRVLWVGIGEGTQPLCALHDALEIPLQDLGYRREERRYTPHVTLGRVKSDRPTDQLAVALARQAGWKGGEITVRELLVMSSELTPKGPMYTVLSRPKLG
ncbi:MAG TPA: RNA 2',3'-cyclic phosphodiesterase [Gemmataceae bacterium]|nr:RNA 2',3'-cyclic phosphodiesterase [Gemmataceae bacterium]